MATVRLRGGHEYTSTFRPCWLELDSYSGQARQGGRDEGSIWVCCWEDKCGQSGVGVEDLEMDIY
jgi:hypothetical protein